MLILSCGPSKDLTPQDSIENPASNTQPDQKDLSPQSKKASFIAKDFELFWDQKILSNEILFQFVGLDINETIALLRNKHDIKVLILPSGKEPNRRLTIGNEPTDHPKLIEYYTKAKQNQSSVVTTLNPNGESRAQYIPAYAHVHRSHISVSRPFQQKPLILVNDSVLKSYLIHEFIHHKQYELRGSQKPVKYHGRLHHPRCKQIFKIAQQKEVVKNKGESLDQLNQRLFRSAAKKKASLDYIFESLHSARLVFDAFRVHGGKELDVYRFIYENRTLLKLSKDEQNHQLIQYADYYIKLEEKLLPMLNHYRQYLDELLERYPNQAGMTLSVDSTHMLLSDIEAKRLKSKAWYDAAVE